MRYSRRKRSTWKSRVLQRWTARAAASLCYLGQCHMRYSYSRCVSVVSAGRLCPAAHFLQLLSKMKPKRVVAYSPHGLSCDCCNDPGCPQPPHVDAWARGGLSAITLCLSTDCLQLCQSSQEQTLEHPQRRGWLSIPHPFLHAIAGSGVQASPRTPRARQVIGVDSQLGDVATIGGN